MNDLALPLSVDLLVRGVERMGELVKHQAELMAALEWMPKCECGAYATWGFVYEHSAFHVCDLVACVDDLGRRLNNEDDPEALMWAPLARLRNASKTP